MDKVFLPVIDTARECLRFWAPFSEKYWWDDPSYPGIGCFGTGYNNWGVQTNQKYLGAMAVIAADEDAHESECFTRSKALERAITALQYSIASHITGPHHCSDGTKWGHHWISPLGIERMMHGVDLIWDKLSENDRQNVNRLLADEADYQLGVEVLGGLWGDKGRNKPESNIWNGAICARAALYNPDNPHKDQWIEKAHEFFINGISVPADAEDSAVVGGKPVKDRHRGPNFFPSYALDHHAYLNVGYMVICISNIAMVHYAHVLRGQKPPESLYHHADGLWNLIRRLIFHDGRLIRIGGDTRIRYCYCQDYLIPALIFAADYFGDSHAGALLPKAIELIKREQATNPDGGFHSNRLAHVAKESLYYYTRLESDKAVALSMAIAWLKQRKIPVDRDLGKFEQSVAGGWEDKEHGAVFHRSPSRMVSWSWRASETPQGLCLSPDDGSLAEWMENLAGSVVPQGKGGTRKVQSHSITSFDGGFVTIGEVLDGVNVEIPEGWRAEHTARHCIAFAALPDNHTAVRIEIAVTPARRTFIKSWAGVKLEIPNDIMNSGIRKYHCRNGILELHGPCKSFETHNIDSPWINIDDRIGLVILNGAESWEILRRGEPIGGHAYGNIYTDAICCNLRTEPADLPDAAVLFDNTCIMLSGMDSHETEAFYRAYKARAIDPEHPECRGAFVQAYDGRNYIFLANPGNKGQYISANVFPGHWVDIASETKLDGDILLGPLTARLFVQER